jgi:hypothetical protein
MFNFRVPVLTRDDGTAAQEAGVRKGIWNARAYELVARQYDERRMDSLRLPDSLLPKRMRRERARAVVIAPRDDYAAQLVAAPLARAMNGPLLLTAPGRLTASVTSLLPEGLREVYVVGNRQQIRPKVMRTLRQELEQWPIWFTRLGGSTRYATAAKVARVIDRQQPRRNRGVVLLVNGKRTGHGPAVAAAAGRRHGAVMLTRGRHLPAATKQFLRHHRSRVFTVGSAAAHAWPKAPRRRTLRGGRFRTAVQLAEHFFRHPRSVVLAGPSDFRSGFLAAAYGAHENAPLVLLRKRSVPPATRRYLRSVDRQVERSLLIGSEGVVSHRGYVRARRLLQ